MTSSFQTRLNTGSKPLRLRTLILLRWPAVVGQSMAVVGVHVGLGFTLPLLPCVGLIALSAWLNIYLHLRYPPQTHTTPRFAATLLGYDIVQLAGLLYLTGGLENPFSMLLLVPVVVSASALPLVHTLTLSALMVGCANLLAFQHFPLPWFPGVNIAIPLLYLIGIWSALVATLAFMAIYTYWIAEDSRQMSRALAATEMVIAREKNLFALDGLAAAAAHELGTPLGTISVVVKELQRAMDGDNPLAEDVALLKSQADRCRDILAKLTSLDGQKDVLFAHMSLGHLIEEVVASHRDFGKEIRITLAPGEKAGMDVRAPVGRRNPAILYGLGNLVENAVDFAKTTVEISAIWDEDSVSI
ncbi:MAG: ActS/PrrB/RegB family redox-sensitive histidine kinase, partial [Fimbriimonadaceae bacterium]|nr:ActS/PrrB/RegB family redox-sensitive histidine kinase [Alphaproteobacteria bacterium]